MIPVLWTAAVRWSPASPRPEDRELIARARPAGPAGRAARPGARLLVPTPAVPRRGAGPAAGRVVPQGVCQGSASGARPSTTRPDHEPAVREALRAGLARRVEPLARARPRRTSARAWRPTRWPGPPSRGCGAYGRLSHMPAKCAQLKSLPGTYKVRTASPSAGALAWWTSWTTCAIKSAISWSFAVYP